MKKEHWHECSYTDFKEIIEEAMKYDDATKEKLIRRQLSANKKFHKFMDGVEELTVDEIETRDTLDKPEIADKLDG